MRKLFLAYTQLAGLLLCLSLSPVLAANPSLEQLKQQLEAAQLANDQEAQETLLNQLLKQEPDNLNRYEWLGSLLIQQNRSDEAIALYQTVIQRQPKATFLYRLLANLYWSKGEKPKAIEILQRGIRNNPNAVDLYAPLGMFLTDEQRTDEAIAVFRQGLKLDDLNVTFFYQSLGQLLVEKDPNAAIAVLQEGLKRQPEEQAYDILMPILADLLGRQNRLPEAIKLYRDGIRRRPDATHLYVGLGMVLTANNRIEEAIALYREGIQRNPKDTSLYVMLGELYGNRNQDNQAIALYREGIQKAEASANLYSLWAELLARRKRFDQAIAVYREGIQRNPSALDLYFSLAGLLEDQKRIEDVIALYQQGIDRERDEYNLLFGGLQDFLIRQKQPDRMLAFYREYVQRRPNDRALLVQMGRFLLSQSRAKEAEAVYRRSIELHPEVIQLAEIQDYINLAAILSQQARGTEAIATVKKAIQFSKKDRSSLFFSYLALSWIQVQEKQFTQATQSMRQAVALNDRVPEANCLLGGLLALQNQSEQAIATYRKLLIKPDEAVVRSPLCTTLGVALLQPDQFDAKIAALRQDQAAYFFPIRPIVIEALVHNLTGEVLQHQGKLREAIAEYEKAIKIDPEFTVAKENLKLAQTLVR